MRLLNDGIWCPPSLELQLKALELDASPDFCWMSPPLKPLYRFVELSAPEDHEDVGLPAGFSRRSASAQLDLLQQLAADSVVQAARLWCNTLCYQRLVRCVKLIKAKR